MATTNPITGDEIKSKPTTENYARGWDLIWNKGRGSTCAPTEQARLAIDKKLAELENECQNEHCNCSGFCKGNSNHR